MTTFSLPKKIRELYHKNEDNASVMLHSFYNETQVIPNPKGDFFSASLAALYAQKGDTICMFIQPPDLLPWRKAYMNGFDGVNTIEINPPIDLTRKGYPTGSIINAFFRMLQDEKDPANLIKGKYFLTLFPTEAMNERAEGYGMRSLLRYDPYVVNSKVEFHSSASKYNYSVCNSFIIKDSTQFTAAAIFAEQSKNGVWLKAEGSGSDLVEYIPHPSELSMRQSWENIKSKLSTCFYASAFTNTDKAQHIDSITGFPRRGLLVEEDISNYGNSFINCAAMLEIDVEGIGHCLGIYNQNPNNDPFCGTNKLEYDQNLLTILDKHKTNIGEIRKKIEYELPKIYRYMREREFVGIFGVDFFVCFSQDVIKIIFTEVNARITNNSGINVVVGMNHGSLHHMPVTGHFPEPVNSVKDLRKYCVIDGIDYLSTDPKQLSILPQAFSAIWRKDDTYKLVEPGYICRLLLLGNDHLAISALTHKFAQKGIIFK